jgi:hypothetical protein
MTTVVLNLDDAAAAKARLAAQRRKSSLEGLLQQFVVDLGQEEATDAVSAKREIAAQKLVATFQQLSRSMGGKGYNSRDELYER